MQCVICSHNTERIDRLEKYKNMQIDENRDVSKDLDEIDARIDYFQKRIITIENFIGQNLPVEINKLNKKLKSFESALGMRPDEPKKEGLTFTEALELMKKNKKAFRSGWKNDQFYIFIDGREFYYNQLDEPRIDKFVFESSDLLADDWKIIED